jgi:hypothetical protein
MTTHDVNYLDDDLALFVARLDVSPAARAAAAASLERLGICNVPYNLTQREDSYYRASQDAICSTCGKPYGRHPFDYTQLYRGSPYLIELCNGDRVKL